ncbi:hypothetical protein BTR23_08125 [Alkalihalophilus pseudofirmus]|nr:hypothetical protein BTR23_08125 [Alkalihalophilus pseudofirmus]
MQLDKSMAGTFKNSIVLINSGNFGIPVSQLVFMGNPLGVSIQMFVMIFQNLLTFTYGLFNSVGVDQKKFKAIVELFKLPILYALFIGLLLNLLEINIPPFVFNPISNIANAFLAIALITMGAQVALLKVHHFSFLLLISICGRLIVSPILAWCVISFLGIEGTTAQALFIASSFPTSRNSALFALEYNNHPDYAAQAVLLTTLASSVTVTLVVFLSRIIF